MREPPARAPRHGFVIRLDSIDSLFDEFDAWPVAERRLRLEARRHLLDEWEYLRATEPAELVVEAPASERASTDEDAIRAAIRASLRAACGPLRLADPLPRHERVGARIGIVVLFVCIVISTALDRASNHVLVEGVSQGILVLGWVALWRPAERLVVDRVPHYFNRRRYAEFAEIPIEFRWL